MTPLSLQIVKRNFRVWWRHFSVCMRKKKLKMKAKKSKVMVFDRK